MKQLIVLGLIMTLFSCGNEKTIQLPAINHSDINALNDISAAYLFYDESQEDSIELNRKNLISTTNWLVNVDKRLTLKQVIPHIKFLQEKKTSSSHKNKDAKNYFSCNDTSKENLGFIEFTDITYHTEPSNEIFKKLPAFSFYNTVNLFCNSILDIKIIGYTTVIPKEVTASKDLINELLKYNSNMNIVLHFNEDLSFQDYIYIKSIIENSELKKTMLLKHEFIFN